MGKWSFLKEKDADGNRKVPEKVSEEPGYAERYAEFKKHCAEMNFEDLSHRLTASRDVKSGLESDLKDINLNIAVLEKLVIEKLEAAGIDSVVAGGYRLTPSPEPVFSKRDPRALREWALESGQADLLTIHSQTLSSIAKDYFLENAEAPPGLELTSTYTKLSRTKQK